MKRLFKLGFLCLILSSLIVASGCYKKDIDNLEVDVNELREQLESDVQTVNDKIVDLQEAIDALDVALNGAIDDGDAATLLAAKTYAEGLRDALLAKIETIEGFLDLGQDGEFVVAETAPNDMLNGTYATLNDFVTKLTGVLDGFSEELAALGIELRGKMQDMVTGISVFYGTDNTDPLAPIHYGPEFGFDVLKVQETRTFGPTEGQISFVVGEVAMSEAHNDGTPILINVSPNNADITNAEFVLYDSTGEDYIANGAFEVSVARYTGGVLTRATVNTGIWAVTLTVKEGATTLPVEGALLSLGVVNNMVDEAAADRIVSTGMNIDFRSGLIPYTPAYFPSTFMPIINTSMPILILANSGANNIWNPAPYLDPISGIFTPGVVDPAGDDRSLLSPFVSETGSTITVDLGTPILNGLRAWYVQLGTDMSDYTTTVWLGTNVVRSTNSEDIDTPVELTIPENNALHRMIVDYNVQGVNIDGTLADPDGVPFSVGIVAPDYTAAADIEFVVELDEDFTTSPELTYTSDEIAFDITDLGFTADFMTGLTFDYEIDLETGFQIDPTASNGVMQVFEGETWVDAVSTETINWADVSKIRFVIDFDAFVPEVAYTGSLVLTEDVAATVDNIDDHVDDVAHAAITLTFPITIKIGEVPAPIVP